MSASPALFSPIKRTRASSDVVAQIRTAIFSGQLVSGDRLPSERELAQQFGVSRVTVRDALRTLEASGLLLIKTGAQGGPYVAEPDVVNLSESLGTHLLRSGTTFREVAEARLALETTATRLACERATAEDLEALRAAIPQPGQPGVEAARMSLEFHARLVSAAHNRALLAMYQATHSLLGEAFQTIRAHQPAVGDLSIQVHEQLLELVSSGDGDQAVALMREHLQDFIERADILELQLRATWDEPRGAAAGSNRRSRVDKSIRNISH